MHFLYFVADRPRAVTLQELPALGLSYAFDDAPVSRGCDRGPDGHVGQVLGIDADRLGYYPERQTWKRVPTFESSDNAAPQPAVYVGFYNDARPTPDDLARSEPISGYWLKLDDGHTWQAPTARRWEEVEERLLWSYNLPQRFTVNDSGKWVSGGIKPRYERLWQLALSYETAAAAACAETDGQEVRFRFEDIDTLAILALQTNYRVGPIECDLLGIYDQESRRRIIDALLDNPSWEAWVKKKLSALAPAGTLSSCGLAPAGTATQAAIAPPVPT